MSHSATRPGLSKYMLTSHLHYIAVPILHIINTSNKNFIANLSIICKRDIPSGQKHSNNNRTLPVHCIKFNERINVMYLMFG
jgi:hypothetical protein